MKKLICMILIIFVVSFGLLCFVSCSQSSDNSSNISIVDMEGNIVSVPNNINKVACISQSATDLMIAFGLGNKIVGTYRSFTYNPWTTVLYPDSANYKSYSYSVSAEELLSDGIELVIIQDTENADAFRNVGIPVIAVHQYSSTGAFDDELYDIARIIGEIFPEAKSKAECWIKDVKDTIEDIKNSIGCDNQNQSVYYINGEKQKGLYYSDGGNSMISRIFDIANIKLATEQYEVLNVHKVSDEEMFNLNPYAMLIGGAYQNYLYDLLITSTVWKDLDCVGNNRVYRIPVAMIGIENVCAETPVMLKYVASLFNENYEYDVIQGLKDNIKKYFNYELSNNDASNMLIGLDKDGKRMVDVK